VARTGESYTGAYLRDLLPAVELEGPRSDREDGVREGDGEEMRTATGDD
jgi:excinuclease ABC subunit A